MAEGSNTVATKTRLPLIVGFGGYNAAGRSSGHLGYRRMIFESLGDGQRAQVVSELAAMMGDAAADAGDVASVTERVLAGTLVRRIEDSAFAVDRVPTGRVLQVEASEQSPVTIALAARDLPDPLPRGWRIRQQGASRSLVDLIAPQSVMLTVGQAMPVQAAGQLPTGFDPASCYRSTHHPRGLQLSILAASDAVQSTGIPWGEIMRQVRPDEIGVYSSSVMSQLDQTGYGGMMQARSKGQRVSSKQLALGLNTMPADFVNAYVLGSVGVTGGVTGACATFLYNLAAAVDEIKSGRRRVVLVGSSEAPILPEVIDGYAAMSALATDADLRRLDGSETADYRRASRPFGENCGFTLGESGQFVVLMDDELALQLGAQIFGAVPGVFINADGFKKSISAPGPGNYITLAKAVALAERLLGDEAVRHRSFLQAHGSSTPHNRVTESKIFDRVARAFGIENWPVAAVKAYLGHSLGPASGDQLMASLGVFAHGILPGIKTIDRVADDVYAERLRISPQDQELGVEHCQVAFLNSKGFGGNNATATVLAPEAVHKQLQRRHGGEAWATYLFRRESTECSASTYLDKAARGDLAAIYRFGDEMIDEDAIEITRDALALPGYAHSILLGGDDGFDDLI